MLCRLGFHIRQQICILPSSTSIRCLATKPDAASKNLLKLLRKETGYPLINCRQALQIADYDYDKAKAHLMEIARQKGLDKLQSSRSMQQGLISLITNKQSAVIVEVNCETDFVAKTLQFQHIVKDTADLILENYKGKTGDQIKTEIPVEEILKIETKEKQTLNESIVMAAGKLRENIQIRRALMLDVTSHPDLHIGGYVHPSVLVHTSRPGSPLGLYGACVLFSIDTDSPYYNKYDISSRALQLIGRDVAQHIVGMNPNRVGKAPKPKMVKIEHDSFDSDESNAPPSGEMVERRLPVDGSRHLLKQAFLLESDMSVAEWLNEKAAKVHDFVRYRVAEKLDEDESK